MRQFQHVEITWVLANQLREIIKPFGMGVPTSGFCRTLYAALLKMEADGLDTINVKFSEEEALIINQFVSSEECDGAAELLTQTWLLLHELETKHPYRHPWSTHEMLEALGAWPVATRSETSTE